MPAIIVWLLGLFSAPDWIKVIVNVAYELWQIIPWFHKPASFIGLREAIRTSLACGSDEPVKEWLQEWSKFNK